MLVGLINYGAGNLYSVIGALKYLNHPFELVSDPKSLPMYTHLILPGVGSFRSAKEKLNEYGLVDGIRHVALNLKKPILGICLGMQLLCDSSDEDGFTEGLKLVKGHFALFNQQERKIPHIGFDTVLSDKYSLLFNNISSNVDFYFVHSYRLQEREEDIIYSSTNYQGETFISAFEKKNIFGTQFHPELSQLNGLKLISNFLSYS